MTETSNTKCRTSKIEAHTRATGGVVDSIVGRSMFDVVAAEESAFVFIRGHSCGAHDDLCSSGGL